MVATYKVIQVYLRELQFQGVLFKFTKWFKIIITQAKTSACPIARASAYISGKARVPVL